MTQTIRRSLSKFFLLLAFNLATLTLQTPQIHAELYDSAIKNSGILPYIIENNEVYFLLTHDKHKALRGLTDFGGGNKHSGLMKSAATEGHEESMGIFSETEQNPKSNEKKGINYLKQKIEAENLFIKNPGRSYIMFFIDVSSTIKKLEGKNKALQYFYQILANMKNRGYHDYAEKHDFVWLSFEELQTELNKTMFTVTHLQNVIQQCRNQGVITGNDIKIDRWNNNLFRSRAISKAKDFVNNYLIQNNISLLQSPLHHTLTKGKNASHILQTIKQKAQQTFHQTPPPSPHTTQPQTQPINFSVASSNVLAEQFYKRHCTSNYIAFSPTPYDEPPFRENIFNRWFNNHLVNNDIIAFQEWQNDFQLKGFKAKKYKDTLIAYKGNKFDFFRKEEKDLGREKSALVLLLHPKGHPTITIGVINCHLPFANKGGINQLQNKVMSSLNRNVDHWIVCGDFNVGFSNKYNDTGRFGYENTLRTFNTFDRSQWKDVDPTAEKKSNHHVKSRNTMTSSPGDYFDRFDYMFYTENNYRNRTTKLIKNSYKVLPSADPNDPNAGYLIAHKSPDDFPDEYFDWVFYSDHAIIQANFTIKIPGTSTQSQTRPQVKNASQDFPHIGQSNLLRWVRVPEFDDYILIKLHGNQAPQINPKNFDYFDPQTNNPVSNGLFLWESNKHKVTVTIPKQQPITKNVYLLKTNPTSQYKFAYTGHKYFSVDQTNKTGRSFETTKRRHNDLQQEIATIRNRDGHPSQSILQATSTQPSQKVDLSKPTSELIGSLSGLETAFGNLKNTLSNITKSLGKSTHRTHGKPTKKQILITLVQGDITEQSFSDPTHSAIVNAANPKLGGGSGITEAIWKKADPSKKDDVYSPQHKLTMETKKILNRLNKTQLETGNAVVSISCDFSSRHKNPVNWIIHTPGPRGVKPQLLKNSYQNSLRVADENNIHTIAIPTISTGIYGYNIKLATPVAIVAVIDYLRTHITTTKIKEVRFVTFGNKGYNIYKDELKSMTGLPDDVLMQTSYSENDLKDSSFPNTNKPLAFKFLWTN